VDAADPREIARHAREQGLLAPGEAVLVAVSGGADSVALAALLEAAGEHGLPLRLTLAHLDHGWRGPEEARQDREVVETLARALDLPLAVAGPPVPRVRGEDAARRWRYAALAALARAHGCGKVAVAHHLRDQAETFLLRLLRGSGAWGLGGIPAARALDGGRLGVVRPLLDVHPEALRAWNRAQGLAWREDQTNVLPGDRNDVRRRLLALEAGRADTPRRLADLAGRLKTRVERRAHALAARLETALERHAPGAAVAVPRALLLGLAPDDLALALRALGAPLRADAEGPWFTGRHLRLAAEVLAQGGAQDLPRGLRLQVSPSRAWLLRRTPRRGAGWTLERRVVPRADFDLAGFRRTREPFTAALDAEVLGPSARLRALGREDRFSPLGLGSGRPTAALPWLAKRGVPAAARRASLVVEGARGVAWVVGERIDAHHAVGPETKTVALLRVLPAD
jgi:tRNA(Ile)-lysidine synthase